MSESEMFEAQGRALARAKQLRSEIATAKAEASRHARILSDINRRTEEFLADPGRQDSLQMPNAFRIVRDLRVDHEQVLRVLATLIEEIHEKHSELVRAEQQIRDF